MVLAADLRVRGYLYAIVGIIGLIVDIILRTHGVGKTSLVFLSAENENFVKMELVVLAFFAILFMGICNNKAFLVKIHKGFLIIMMLAVPIYSIIQGYKAVYLIIFLSAGLGWISLSIVNGVLKAIQYGKSTLYVINVITSIPAQGAEKPPGEQPNGENPDAAKKTEGDKQQTGPTAQPSPLMTVS